jgi:hypothetical protein
MAGETGSGGWNCAGRGLPIVGIRIRMRSGSPNFRFDFACEESKELQVDSVSITDPEDDAFPPTVLCELRMSGKVRLFPSEGWTYGEPISGFQLRGGCAPLLRGRAYEVTVLAGGAGDAVFLVEADGTLRILREDCDLVKSRDW